MEVLWNKIDLQKPPFRSWRISVENFDLKKFRTTFDRILSDFKIFKSLNAEAALLSRLIYRMKSKFRSDKGLKGMEKVNRALLNYLEIDLPKDYKFIAESVEADGQSITLPARQILEYILVKTQSFAKVMSRIEQMSQTSAKILKARMSIGQSWSVAMIAYAVISRIWLLSRYIIKRSCHWYSEIYRYVNIFNSVGVSWLPDNYVLPTQLSQWLNVEWLSKELDNSQAIASSDKSIFSVIEVTDDNYKESIGNGILDEDDLQDGLKTITRMKIYELKNPIQEVDVGEIISREEYKKCVENLRSVEKDLQTHTPEHSMEGVFMEEIKSREEVPIDIEKEMKIDAPTFSAKIVASDELACQEQRETSILKPDKKLPNIKKVKKKKTDKSLKLLKDIKSEKDLVYLLQSSHYPGLSETQWYNLRKSVKTKVVKLMKKQTNDKPSEDLYIKVNKFIKSWKTGNLN